MNKPSASAEMRRLLAFFVVRQTQRLGRQYDILKKEFDKIRYGNSYRKEHIIVSGLPRSGTSLLYNMLCSCLDGFNYDDWERESSPTLARYENHISKNFVDIFCLNMIKKSNIHDKKIYFIILIRDIRDVITSVHPNIPTDYFIGYKDRYSVRGYYPNYQITVANQGIRDFFEAIDDLKSSNCRAVFIRYEDLVTDPNRIQNILEKNLGIAFEESFSEYHLHTDRHGMKFEQQWQALDPSIVKSHKKVNRENIGRWLLEKHKHRIIKQFTQHPELFAILRAYGYEQNDGWFQRVVQLPIRVILRGKNSESRVPKEN